MESWLDLHMHSEWSSDGEFKPSILMQIGYGIYPDDVNLQKNDEFVHDQEVENSKKLLRAVHGIGFEFTDEEVLAHAKRDVIVAETIAEVVLKDPRNDDNDLLVEFRPGGKKSDNPLIMTMRRRNFIRKLQTSSNLSRQSARTSMVQPNLR